MKDIELNRERLQKLLDIIINQDVAFLMFKDKFAYEMAKTSCHMLENMNLLAIKYRNSYSKQKTNSDKLLLLFGILQGLFVAIDSLYTIGKTTNVNKIFLNINQNDSLRAIKHIRNDVVGHPTHRYFEDSIGFCTLDLDHINGSEIKYLVYVERNGEIIINEKKVDLLDVIDDYYLECNDILLQNIELFDIKNRNIKIDISSLVSLLGYRFNNSIKDYDLLSKIYLRYQELFPKAKRNRVKWRLDLIEFLFDYHEENEYLNYLTILEIFKLYNLLYQLEKQINRHISFKFVKFEKHHEFTKLRMKLNKIKKNNFDKNILHDSNHPLYLEHMNLIVRSFSNDDEVKNLITWIKKQLDENNSQMLYLIGSELKK
ncbi:MAG TPA: hypothetical protein GXZ48_06870 [Acholeplasmataceae bacterium]|nr:hypothetical protein [Acholeplasmataceae bacterium]